MNAITNLVLRRAVFCKNDHPPKSKGIELCSIKNNMGKGMIVFGIGKDDE